MRPALLLLLPMIGCATVAPVPASPPPDPSLLLELDRAFDLATFQRGEAGFAEFIADDATLMFPNHPLEHGKALLLERWKPVFEHPGSVRWQPAQAELATSGELGWTFGNYTSHDTDGQGQPVDHHGKYLTLWKRFPDGKWRVVGDVGNASPAP
jgi:ketosteroid isomerase-like protein